MVADLNEKFVSQRRYPSMALIKTSITDSEIELDAPGMPILKLPVSLHGQRMKYEVWGHTLFGIDCGDEAAKWISSYLHTPLRVVFTDPSTQTLNMAASGKDKWHKSTREQDKVGFQDFAPIMIASQASLDDLNSRMDNPVDMRRFRPNFTITGAAAFDEDNWIEILIGSHARFTVIKPCSRCIMTTVNPDSGIKESKEPFETLKQYRIDRDLNAACFGLHLGLNLGGIVRIGDPVYAVRGSKWWQK